MSFQQVHIVYSGAVQGVGFRYTAQQIARDLNLTGWIKNLNDGRVEILVEGPREGIEELLAHINNHFEGYIRNKDISYQPALGAFKEFRIEY